MKPIIRFIRVNDPERVVHSEYISATLPSYATADSSGFDFVTTVPVTLEANVPTLIPTGWKIEIDESTCKDKVPEAFGIELQIRPRSGLALKEGITVLNTPGTIDKDYRGEIGVIAYWTGYENPDSAFTVTSKPCTTYGQSDISYKKYLRIPAGTKIAQGVLVPIYKGFITEAEDFKEKDTERGEGGFGSTDK